MTVGVATTARSESVYADADALDAAVDAALASQGLAGPPGRRLAGLVRPGRPVLVKPNWVLHRNLGGGDMACMVTQPAFVLAVLRQLRGAAVPRLVVGDAPIQMCDLDALLPADFAERAADAAGRPVDVVDLRQVATHSDDPGRALHVRPATDFVLFDLGADSMLEPVTGRRPRFRVTNYDPRELSATHRAGRHRYLVAREALDAGLVINVPKLKTHRKTGVTGAMKNLVGVNGSKAYLPHHRIGGSALGGDCYPGLSPIRLVTELVLDQANRRLGRRGYHRLMHTFSRLQTWQAKVGEPEVEGGWQGNDTTWRMVHDINHLVRMGQTDGVCAAVEQRTLYTITDAIVAGDGEGPLAPDPVAAGFVTASDSTAHADLVHLALMGLDPARVPLVREALRAAAPTEVVLDGVPVDIADLFALAGTAFRPPRLWPDLAAPGARR